MSEPERWGKEHYRSLVPVTERRANKYSRGTVLVAGGSAAYPGAPVLASLAASRSGAGYVRLCAPEPAAHVARHHLLSIPVSTCGHGDVFKQDDVDEVLAAGKKSKVLVVGPGLLCSDDTVAFIAKLLECCSKPMVIDADALNAISIRPTMMIAREDCTNILTPHAGEAARLLGKRIDNPLACAQELSELYNAVVVLKGHETIVAENGRRPVICSSGGPELAKAGTGDVLAGMIGAFAAQGLEAFDAANLAVYLHGCAGALAAQNSSVLSVMPEDVVEQIGPAVAELSATAVNTEGEFE